MAGELGPLIAELDALTARLEAARPFNIGFPGAIDFDYAPLAPLFAHQLLNNVGDPDIDGIAANHTKAMEREVVSFVADLLRAPADDRWGYVTTGASEGTLYALHLARSLYPGAVIYHSEAAHASVAKAIELLGMPQVVVCADEHGELDYDDLASQIACRRDRPAVVVANIGTTLTEAVDDVRRISAVLDGLAVYRRFVHADAALSGIPLALLDPSQRPGFDFADGADSLIVSGHKFIGSPMPCGVVVVKASHRSRLAPSLAYTGSPDVTITGLRSGHAALVLWYALRRFGIEGLRTRAEQCRELAAYTHGRLVGIGWSAHRHEHAFTVVLKTPPAPVTDRWVLASHGEASHIVCMPGITRKQIDAFVPDLRAAICATPPTATTNNNRRSGLLRRTRPTAPPVAMTGDTR